MMVLNSHMTQELFMQVHRDVLKEQERQGELRLRQEAARFLEETGSEGFGFGNRIRLTMADFLISSGLKLKGQPGSDSPAAAFQMN